MNAASARRLHLLYQGIDFDLLRPVFKEHCQLDECDKPYPYIQTFDELVDYTKALDGLLVQAVEKNKTLYVFASG
jgi:hypothetical protein